MPEDRHPGTPGGGSGADVKSGIEIDLPDGTGRDVTFGAAFASVPHVVVSFAEVMSAVDVLGTQNVTTTGFRMHIHKGHGGSGHNRDVHWIATDAGDP